MAADIADLGAAWLAPGERRLQRPAHLGGVLDQPLVLDDVEHGHAHGRLKRSRGEGVEIAGLGAEALDQRPTGRRRRQGQARPHRLAGDDDVGGEFGDAVAPPAAGAAIAGLDLVGDHQAARVTHHAGRPVHESARHVRQTLVGEDRTDDQRRQPHPGRLQLRDRLSQLLQIGVGERVFVKSRRRRPELLGKRKGPRLGVRRLTGPNPGQAPHQLAVTVIGGVGADDAAPAGGETRHSDRHLVGLGAAAAEDDALDRRSVQGAQPFGEGDDAIVQIAVVDVEQPLLSGHRLGHPRVAVTHTGHVVVHVHIAPALGVEEADPLAAHDRQRPRVEKLGAGSERPVSPLQQARPRHFKDSPVGA